MNKLILTDCMKYMKTCADNQFDLAMPDPDYGIGPDWLKDSRGRKERRFGALNKSYQNDNPPDKEYFDELFRISKYQIIWGWNYYADLLPPTNYIIIWDKMRDVKKTFRSECEQAWTNIKIPQRIYHIRWDGCKKGNETGITTIHPHQKPISIYKIILSDYAKPGWKLFDTHSGSGSFRIAAHDLGFDLISCELDPDYYRDNESRYQKHIQQADLFSTEEIQKLTFKQGEL